MLEKCWNQGREQPHSLRISSSSWSSKHLLNLMWYSNWSSEIEQSIFVSRDMFTTMNGNWTTALKIKRDRYESIFRIKKSYFECFFSFSSSFFRFLSSNLLKATCWRSNSLRTPSWCFTRRWRVNFSVWSYKRVRKISIFCLTWDFCSLFPEVGRPTQEIVFSLFLSLWTIFSAISTLRAS